MLRGWFGSSALDRQLDEELQFHFDRQVQANLEAGMLLEQARRSAALAIGTAEPIREASRDARAGALLRQAGRDLSYGMRLLTKTPGFSIAAIAIIALGVGAVTAIFSVVYGVALEPLPFHEPDRLVNLWSTSAKLGAGRFQVTGADHRDWRQANHVFEDIALVRALANFNLTGSGEPERVLAARLSANLLPVLGVSPVIGRGFNDDEDEIGHEQVVLLSDGLWRRRFGGDPSIVGRDLVLSGVPHTVVGIMGKDFQYPGREFQLWTPLTINPDELARKVPGNNFVAIARLEKGVTIEQAQSEMDTIAVRLAATFDSNRDTGVVVVATHADLLGTVRSALSVMLGAVICLLLVAALNLSGLLSARAAARSREFAVRLALGATRGRIAAQLVAEIVPLLVAGGMAGVGLAVWAVASFVPLAPPSLPRAENIAVSGVVLAASIALLAVTGLIASLMPVAQAWRSGVAAGNHEQNRTATGGVRHTRARNLLVVTQIALSLPLLTGAVLLARTFTTVTAIDPGFRSENVISLHLAIPRSKYAGDRQIAQVTGRFLDRVAAVPGVTAAGMVNRLPLGGGAQIGVIAFDAPGQARAELPSVDWRTVTPGYFQTLGIPIVEGRSFDGRDKDGAPLVGIIDERIAKLVWPGESAIGKRFRIPLQIDGADLPWHEIVGVVGHVKHDGLDLDTRPQVYWNYEQRAQDRMVVVARGAGNVTGLMPAIIQAIRDVDPEQAVYDVRTMDDVVQRSLGQRWLNMILIGAFASISLVLCCIGVYGVIAFGVTRQRREFGIRMALGASRRAVATLVLGRGLALAGIGTLAGLAMAALLARSMSSMLYGVDPNDAASFAAATAAILIAAAIASYLPARRAAAVDPAVTLRE